MSTNRIDGQRSSGIKGLSPQSISKEGRRGLFNSAMEFAKKSEKSSKGGASSGASRYYNPKYPNAYSETPEIMPWEKRPGPAQTDYTIHGQISDDTPKKNDATTLKPDYTIKGMIENDAPSAATPKETPAKTQPQGYGGGAASSGDLQWHNGRMIRLYISRK